jgi:periplasmic divalent cation tolerance protein
MKSELLVVLCTVPNVEEARRIGRALVEEKLIACANLVLPGIESIYCWEGDIQTDTEVLMLLKTNNDAFPRLEARLAELHPYQVPEIVALAAQHVAQAYARWVEENVRS